MDKQKLTICDLRRNNFKVRVYHTDPFNIPEKFAVSDKALTLSKIATCIEVRDTNGIEHTGVALCSKFDNWNRKLGNKIALGRALKSIPQELIDKQFGGIS